MKVYESVKHSFEISKFAKRICQTNLPNLNLPKVSFGEETNLPKQETNNNDQVARDKREQQK